MAHCTNCYGTSTVEPCDSVGCLSTNYGKCITYSGSNLFCQSGSIATFTFTGTAVAPTVDTTVTASATGGSGSGATFTVIRRAGETTYEVTLDDIGSAYEVSDELTIAGTDLGGTSPTNDITITVTTLQAVIANGQNLDVIIANLNSRLCLASEASPAGLDYTAFNYSCLREGGNLEGVGTAITTAKAFVEATAAALCSLNVRVGDVETPGIVVDPYFSGTLTSGTSTHIDIFNAYGAAIGDLNDKFTINSTATCGAFTRFTNLTAKPSSTASLGNWFDWVYSNICTIYGEIDNYFAEVETQLTDTHNLLYGLSQPYPSSGKGNLYIDTSCLTGGSSTMNLRDAGQLLTDELCSLITTVGTTSNYTVNWNCFTAPYTSNSVFAAQGLGSFTNTTTLQAHLDQTAQALSALNIQFSSDFTVTNGTCGPVVSLAAGSSFTCSLLSTCTLDNLADVAYNSLGANQVLYREASNQYWRNVTQSIKTRVYTGGSLGYEEAYNDFTYESGTGKLVSELQLPIQDKGLLGQSTSLPTSWSLTHAPLYSQLPRLQIIKSSGMIIPWTDPGFSLNNTSGSPIVFSNNATIDVLSFTTNQFKSPDFFYIPISVIEKDASLAYVATHNIAIRINGNSVNNEVIGLTNISGQNISIAAGHYLEVYFGGVTWPTAQ